MFYKLLSAIKELAMVMKRGIYHFLGEYLTRLKGQKLEEEEKSDNRQGGPSTQLKEIPKYRLVDTRSGGPNMPKYQPCSVHRVMGKRKQKTVGGAEYWCRRCHITFFVRSKVR